MSVTNAEVDQPIDRGYYVGGIADFPFKDQFCRHIGARIFGKLMNNVVSTVQHYRSDWYYDALSLNDALGDFFDSEEESLEFIYGCRETGTNLLLEAIQGFTNTLEWKCTLYKHRYSWYLKMERI